MYSSQWTICYFEEHNRICEYVENYSIYSMGARLVSGKKNLSQKRDKEMQSML